MYLTFRLGATSQMPLTLVSGGYLHFFFFPIFLDSILNTKESEGEGRVTANFPFFLFLLIQSPFPLQREITRSVL